MPNVDGAPGATRGLFSGFEGYRSPTENDVREAISSWLVVLDTNVLLSLYNYHGTTLADLHRVFQAFGDRLFVPHQVADEFWRNRRTVLSENQGRNRERASIESAFEEIRKSFNKWYTRVVDRAGRAPKEVSTELDEAVEAMLQHMDEMNAEFAPAGPDTPTNDDPVIHLLEPLLEGKVGPPPASSELHGLFKEGRRRVEERIPPGYLDAAKAGDRASGDFFVWHQTMAESKRRGTPVLFVTQDQKEDWWVDRGTASMRARPELVQELLEHSGQRLLMVRSHDLLRFAEELGVDVSATTLKDAKQAEVQASGWTPDTVAAYMEILRERWPDHLEMLKVALADTEERSIARRAMARILGRRRDAPMTGITRPYFTAMKVLLQQGYVDEEPTVPMYARYQEGGFMSHLVVDDDVYDVFAAAAPPADVVEEGAAEG